MITDIIDEKEFTRRFAEWVLENDRTAVISSGGKADFIDSFRLPDISYIHTQSAADSNGDLVSLLKGEYIIKDWKTKSAKKDAVLSVYKVLKTPSSSPDTEPYLMGYIIAY